MFTSLNDEFMITFEPFIKSFLYYNSWFDYDFVILDLGLSMSTKERCLKLYPKCKFIKPKKENYKDVNFAKTHLKLQPTYYKLDMFSRPYDRVVSIDVDMIVQGYIREVFDCDKPIAGCQGYIQRKDKLSNEINTGLVVINKEFLNDETYKRLIAVAKPGHNMPDQKTINQYFKNRIHFLPKKYNCEKRIWRSERFKMWDFKNAMTIIHYVGYKPWQKNKPDYDQGYDELEAVWWEWKKLV